MSVNNEAAIIASLAKRTASLERAASHRPTALPSALPVPIAEGGTGATDVPGAQAALGIVDQATYTAEQVAQDGRLDAADAAILNRVTTATYAAGQAAQDGRLDAAEIDLTAHDGRLDAAEIGIVDLEAAVAAIDVPTITLRPTTLQSVYKGNATTAMGTSPGSPTYISDTYLLIDDVPYARFFTLSWMASFSGDSAIVAARPMYQIDGAGGFVHGWTIDWGITSIVGAFDSGIVSGTFTREIPANQQIELRLYGYAGIAGVVANHDSRTWQSLLITPVAPVVVT